MGTRPNQDQVGGESSTNYQAGQDIHIHGLTITEARAVALDVFRSNALELSGIARTVASARAEELTNEFLRKIETDMPERASKLADPDVQSVLFDAQKEFARSGEEDLKVALVELLAARSREGERNLRTLALNEAIVSAAKLTEAQRRSIAWIFYLRYTRDADSSDSDAYFAQVKMIAESLGVDIPSGRADYQHIEYVGAGSIGLTELSFGRGLLTGVEGLFTQGFDPAEVDAVVLERLQKNGLVVQAARNADHLRLDLVAAEELGAKLVEWNLTADGEEIKAIMSIGRLTDVEVADEAIAIIPELSTLRSVWDAERSAIRSVSLTSVGIAIGHAYWSRLTDIDVPLAVWLP